MNAARELVKTLGQKPVFIKPKPFGRRHVRAGELIGHDIRDDLRLFR